MPMTNAAGEAYTQTNLTDLFNDRPRQPAQMGQRVPVQSQGVTTISCVIDRKGSEINVIDPKAYGDAPSQTEVKREKPVTLYIPHYPDEVVVRPEEVSGQRAVGSEGTFEVPQDLLNEKLDAQRVNFEVTWEFGLINAARGFVIDSEAEVVVDVAGQFGIAPTQLEIDLEDDELDLNAYLRNAKRELRARLGQTMVANWLWVLPSQIYEPLVKKPKVERSYERYQEGAFLRTDQTQADWVYNSNVSIIEYDNLELPSGLTVFPEDEGLLIPVVPGLFQRRFAPKQGMTTVNTVGRPLYATPKDLDDDAGTRVRTQSNFVTYCRKLGAIGRTTIK